MPSYPRDTQVTQVFVPQEFKDFITINGEKVRPYRRVDDAGNVVFGWEMEKDGDWVVVTEREIDNN